MTNCIFGPSFSPSSSFSVLWPSLANLQVGLSSIYFDLDETGLHCDYYSRLASNLSQFSPSLLITLENGLCSTTLPRLEITGALHGNSSPTLSLYAVTHSIPRIGGVSLHRWISSSAGTDKPCTTMLSSIMKYPISLVALSNSSSFLRLIYSSGIYLTGQLTSSENMILNSSLLLASASILSQRSWDVLVSEQTFRNGPRKYKICFRDDQDEMIAVRVTRLGVISSVLPVVQSNMTAMTVRCYGWRAARSRHRQLENENHAGNVCLMQTDLIGHETTETRHKECRSCK